MSDLTYYGFRVDVAHASPRWFRATRENFRAVLEEYEAWRDENGYGARDIGGSHTLYRMSPNGLHKEPIGHVGYNGRVFK